MAKVKATLTHGRNGGRAVAWIAGVPQGFSRQYVFPAGKSLEIDEADADALRAGKIDTGGRVFVVAPPVTRTGAADTRGGLPPIVIPDGNEDSGAPAPKAKA